MTVAHQLSPLPYGYDALEPHIDTLTMQIHHDKHHATYVNNLNAALEKHPVFPDATNVEFATVESPGTIRIRIWRKDTGLLVYDNMPGAADSVIPPTPVQGVIKLTQ